MRRREFISLVGVTAAWPLAARAQQSAMPVVGWLGSDTRQSEDYRLAHVRQGLKEIGYIEGQNLAIEYSLAEGQYDRLPALAAELVRRQVNVIALHGLPAARAAKAATTTTPIVFEFANDPVRLGLVASLNRPGGNITGVSSLNVEVEPKQLDLLHELVPDAAVIGVLVNPNNPDPEIQKDAQDAARRLGLRLLVLHASTDRDFDAVFANLVQLRARALLIGPDALFTSRAGQLGELAFRHAIPAISPYREFSAAGGLMSYGTNIANLYRQVGIYAGRILKGEKPGELPVQQAVMLELIINLKAAKALGLTIPPTLFARADEVIQ
jgi:putative tryptophan/tyrosine transport system substrate-binding protein